jgi:hypothetical protein
VYQAEIETKTLTISEIEQRMQALTPFGVPSLGSSNDQVQVTITQLEKMRDAAATNWGPIVLRAPISGMVSLVYRQQGEHIVDGEPLLAINSHWADRIVGYLRQPYPIDPQIGMSVLVTTQERKSRKFWTEISQIGAQLEIITNSLAFVRQGALVDAGLPIVVDVPKGMHLRPGETVNLVFRGKPAAATPVLEAPAPGRTAPAPGIRRDSPAEHAGGPLPQSAINLQIE